MKDVVEGLKQCFWNGGCTMCPYNEYNDGNSEKTCLDLLIDETIDILTKRQSENEALKAQLGAAQQAINSMKSKLRAAGLYSN